MIIISLIPLSSKISRHSRTKKSIFGAPIPIATILTGTPLYLPVKVRNPRSEWSENSSGSVVVAVPPSAISAEMDDEGSGSNSLAIPLARAGSPTVIYGSNESKWSVKRHKHRHQRIILTGLVLTIRLANCPALRPR